MTKAVSGGMGVAEVGTGLGALPLLGKKAARTPSAHPPPHPQGTSPACQLAPCPPSLPSPLD